MCMTDYDRPSMYNARIQKARKQHQCGECFRHIGKGESYQYVSAIWDGEFGTAVTCAHCLVGQRLLVRECNGFMHGGIDEDLQEHIHELLPWSMQAARLVVGMRRKWKRFHSDQLMPVPSFATPPDQPAEEER